MIDELIVQGFQSHREAILKFSPGVNLILGISHSGKTALLRAITLVANNRPRGDAFINWSCEEVFAALICHDDKGSYTISRGRGKSDNYYSLRDGEGKTITYRAFGTEVPDAIRERLNFSDVNIQKQLSLHYMVLSSPGQIAQHIRQLAKLDEIDDILKMIKTDITGLNKDIVRVKKELEAEQTELKTYDMDVQQVEDWVAEVDLQEIILKKRQEELEEYTLLLDRIAIADALVEKLEGFDAEAALDKVALSIALTNEGIAVGNGVIDLQNILSVIREANKQMPGEMGTLEDDVLSAINGVSESDITREENLELGQIIFSLKSAAESEMEYDSQIAGHEIDRVELLERLTECPSCGSELTPDTKKKLLGESNVVCKTKN